jgi:hypothetical protein
VRRRFEVFEMHMVIYALVESSTLLRSTASRRRSNVLTNYWREPSFGLLYLATGRLALPIGVHGEMAATTGVLFRTGPTVEGGPSIVAVTETLPGLLGTVSARRMPQLVVAALLLAGYLQWRHGSLSIDRTVTEWIERGGGIIGSSSVPQRD